MKWLFSKDTFYTLVLISSFTLFLLLILHSFVGCIEERADRQMRIDRFMVETSGSAKDAGK